MPVYYNKPEVALKRAEELTTIKEYSKAIQILHESVLSMHYYKDSTSTSSSSSTTTSMSKKNYTKQQQQQQQQQSSNLGDSPSVRIIKRIHELSPIVKTKKFFKEALHAFKNQSLQSSSSTSSLFLLSQLSHLILTSLELKEEEDYRIVLDVLKNNSKLEELYAKVVTEKILSRDTINLKKIVELCHGHLLQSIKYNQIHNSELLIEVRLRLLRRCSLVKDTASCFDGDMLKLYQDILLLDSEYEFSTEDGMILRELFNHLKNYELELKYSTFSTTTTTTTTTTTSSVVDGNQEEYLLASICSSSSSLVRRDYDVIKSTSSSSSSSSAAAAAAVAAVVKLYNLLNTPSKFRLSQLKQVFTLIGELDQSSTVFKKYRKHLLYNVVLKKSIQLLKRVYSEVSFDFLEELFHLNGADCKYFKFHEIELELLRQGGGGGGAVVSHAKRRVYFHGIGEVVLNVPSSSLLKSLNNLSSGLKEQYLKERSVYSKRKEVIEKRKEEMEQLMIEREERERRELHERIQKEELESRRILEEEAKRRELERLKREEEEIKLKEAEKLKKELNLVDVAETELLMDRDAILKAQYERLQQERLEQERRIAQLKKRMDHQERAYRREEQKEKLPQREEELKREKLKRHEEAYEMLKQASEKKFKSDLELKQRFISQASGLKKDYEQYRQQLVEKYDSEYNELVKEKQQQLQQEKQQRLEQLRRERREQLIKEKKEKMEKELKEKEQREKEEAMRREKEERWKEMELIREEQRKKMEREEEAMRRRETFGGKTSTTGGGAAAAAAAASGSKSYQPPHARKGGSSGGGGGGGGNRFSALGGQGGGGGGGSSGQGGSGYDGGSSDRRQTTSSSFFNRNK